MLVRTWIEYGIPKEQGCLSHQCGTEVWIWCNHARCGVQSAPCHIQTNLSFTGPLISCWPQIGHHQSSGGWAEPRHSWGGRNMVVVGRMREWRIGAVGSPLFDNNATKERRGSWSGDV